MHIITEGLVVGSTGIWQIGKEEKIDCQDKS